MIESITFKNFKALRDCTLPLGRFTLLIGPNGSGKSTLLQGIEIAGGKKGCNLAECLSSGASGSGASIVIQAKWSDGTVVVDRAGPAGQGREGAIPPALQLARVYSLRADTIATPMMLEPNMTLGHTGAGLAGVLDRLRDQHPERWDALNAELGKWFPDFDHILFDTPAQGQRAIALRMRKGGHMIPASQLSQGTLLALAMLTLAYLPDPPPVVGFEEPDRGIHPRLLRDVRDAMYRLAYPESVGEDRDPVQVIATTHSPYMLDLFKDHPDEIVIAQKLDDNVQFKRLSEMPHIDEILESAPLGEVWYSGVLGGAPAGK